MKVENKVMRTTLKIITATFLMVILLFNSALCVFAAMPNGKITVKLEDKDKNKINGAVVNICCVAEYNGNGFYPTKAFENSGISISAILNNPDENTAKSVSDYVKKNSVDLLTDVTKDSIVVFSDLKLGIWLVCSEENSQYSFNPYFVILPFESNGKLYYEITSAPKFEYGKPTEINIRVVKKWDDNNNAAKKRPDSVTVELFNDDRLISSVVLDETNGWAHTFTGLSKQGNYSVKEKKVADYKVNYGGDAVNGFVVTNTYQGEKLPQTGQYWWPIIVLLIAGVCFVLLGVYELGAKRNGKKK